MSGGRASASDGSARSEGGLYAVGSAVAKLVAPIVRRRGGGLLARCKAEWATIVGAEWSRSSWPVALSRDGALKLRVPSAAALEIQHRAPLLIERVNSHFGRDAVSRLVIQQGTLPARPEAFRPTPRRLAAREEKALEDRLSNIADPELKAALARLGRAVEADRD
jgi:hypothetical protein